MSLSLPPTNNGDFKHRNKTRVSNKRWDFVDIKFIVSSKYMQHKKHE